MSGRSGLPRGNTPCKICTHVPAWPKSRLCRSCITRIQRNGYTWTDEQDEIVRRAYTATTGKELRDNLDHAVRVLGRSRSCIGQRAKRLGCIWLTKKPWRRDEIELLREHVNEWTINHFVKVMRRSHFSILGQIARLKMSHRFTEGYSQIELASLMGSSDRTMRKWVAQGLLCVRRGRISDLQVRAFLHSHPELYSLKRVDESWYKAMLFENAPCFAHKARPDRELAA